jgi:predicted metal-dependent peptidase
MGSKVGTHAKDVLTPKVDWRKQLREFNTRHFAGTDISTWARPNRRYIGAGHYMPTSYNKVMRELVIAIDASGSTFGRVMAQFLGEIQRIATTLRIAKVRILYWDTEICGDEVYTPTTIKDIIQSTKPHGGGGTVVQCVPDYMAAQGINPQAVIVLTDGELGGQWGKWSSVPLLWCVVNHRKFSAPVGKTIFINNNN